MFDDVDRFDLVGYVITGIIVLIMIGLIVGAIIASPSDDSVSGAPTNNVDSSVPDSQPAAVDDSLNQSDLPQSDSTFQVVLPTDTTTAPSKCTASYLGLPTDMPSEVQAAIIDDCTQHAEYVREQGIAPK